MEIIRDKERKPPAFGMFCGNCSTPVPQDRKHISELFQMKVPKTRNKWVVSLSYVCPRCLTPTRIMLFYSKSIHEWMKKINVYGEYAPLSTSG